MLGVVLINAKTHMVVMEVVSQHLDQYKNNGIMVSFTLPNDNSLLIVYLFVCLFVCLFGFFFFFVFLFFFFF